MTKRVPVKQAAEELGLSEYELRYRMRTDKEFEKELGLVLPPKKKNGNWRYFIYGDKLNKITGVQDGEQGDSGAGKESA